MNKALLTINISFLFLAIFLTGCNNQKQIQKTADFKYSIEKPIEGQLHTAKRLKGFMAEKKYEEAINLFSKKQQLDIRKIQTTDEKMFQYWCYAWALEDEAYNYYCARIKNGNGMFAFEGGEWKINEK